MAVGKEIITFRRATPEDWLFIAHGFHMAMLYDDADEQRIENFGRLICKRQDVLYSARNTIIAMVDGKEAGMITAYNGEDYAEMRRITFGLVKSEFGWEFPGMEDEALPGDYYLDSLAVWPAYRGKGIGTSLLKQAIANGKALGLPRITLAVDPINSKAQALYESLGFKYEKDIFIFGHDYRLMVIGNE